MAKRSSGLHLTANLREPGNRNICYLLTNCKIPYNLFDSTIAGGIIGKWSADERGDKNGDPPKLGVKPSLETPILSTSVFTA